jgi:predicted nucleic acid-binding protein
MNTYTLDACALLAVLYRETGYEMVENILQKANSTDVIVTIHKITLLEVYKKIFKDQGTDAAEKTYEKISNLSIQIFDTLTQEFFKKFAEIHINNKTHFADTFVATTNLLHTNNGTIVTSDHDFDVLLH